MTEPLINLVQRYYQLVPWSVTLLQARAERIVLQVKCQERTVVVKSNRNPQAFSRIKRDLYFVRYAAAFDLALPELIPTKAAQLYVETETELFYVMAFIAGDEPSQHPLFYTRAGDLLGKLHSLPVVDYPYPMAMRLADDIQYIRTGLKRFQAAHGIGELDELDAILHGLLALPCRPLTVIHTDFFSANLRMSRHEDKLYLLDFDDAGLGEPLLDIGYFIAKEILRYRAVSSLSTQVVATRQAAQGHGHIVLDPQNLAAFLRAYQQNRQLAAIEMDHLIGYIYFSTLWYLYDWTQDDLGSADLCRYFWLRDHAAFLRQLLIAGLP